jgi:hypothetical protein
MGVFDNVNTKIETKKPSVESANTVVKTETSSEKPYMVSVFGYKGAGKTYNALGLCRKEQKILLVSFDGVSGIVASQFFPEFDITVYNAIKNPTVVPITDAGKTYFIESVDNGFNNLQELINFLVSLENKSYDVVIFDGLNFAERLSEAYMRKVKGLRFDENFSDFNNWKIRNSQLNGLFVLAKQKTKDIVIHTVYVEEHPTKKEGGSVISSVEMPNYVKDITALTVVEIRIDRVDEQTRMPTGEFRKDRRWKASIFSSKIKSIPTGAVYDVTGKLLSDVIKL